MLFNSYIFVGAFLPLVVSVFYALSATSFERAPRAWVVFASFVFYGWWSPWYLLLLLGSIVGNYLIFLLQCHVQSRFGPARRRARKPAERRVLFLGIAFNLLLLGFFKYVDFAIENFNLFTGDELDLLKIALPLGISFFSLQQLAFQVDAYEGAVDSRGFLDYTLFVAFFPQLVAGPIVHHKEMLSQINSAGRTIFDARLFYAGIFLFLLGLFKKVVVADTFSPWVANAFDTGVALTSAQAWLASVCYTLQLYFDFSAYSDMAIGLGWLFGLRLPLNFNAPLRSTSLIEFWTRWHMTLGRFIRTYLHFPIARAMPRPTFSYGLIATFMAMLIAGIWHGAAWTFVVFGAVHGLGLVVNNSFRRLKIRLPAPLGWAATMWVILHANVYFRASTIADAHRIIEGMYSWNNAAISLEHIHALTASPYMVDVVIFGIATSCGTAAVFYLPTAVELAERLELKRHWAWAAMLLLVINVAFMSDPTEFLYFNF